MTIQRLIETAGSGRVVVESLEPRALLSFGPIDSAGGFDHHHFRSHDGNITRSFELHQEPFAYFQPHEFHRFQPEQQRVAPEFTQAAAGFAPQEILIFVFRETRAENSWSAPPPPAQSAADPPPPASVPEAKASSNPARSIASTPSLPSTPSAPTPPSNPPPTATTATSVHAAPTPSPQMQPPPTPAAAPEPAAPERLAHSTQPHDDPTILAAPIAAVHQSFPILARAPLAIAQQLTSLGTSALITQATAIDTASELVLAEIIANESATDESAPEVEFDQSDALVASSELAPAFLQGPLISSLERAGLRVEQLRSPARWLSDSLATFAEESASISQNISTRMNTRKAWLITFGVLAVDAIVLANHYRSKSLRKRKRSHPPFRLATYWTPISTM